MLKTNCTCTKADTIFSDRNYSVTLTQNHKHTPCSSVISVKVNPVTVHVKKAHRSMQIMLYPFLTFGTKWSEWSP